ncbi:BspA family leucine-rich repeat surface protein [Vibrio splendidus]|nr:BspA family leucine-rich repeat surface protein [Vibrio splendidus]MCC4881884.1 DUF285 domain-containing protein [Vibrio splendidus]
MKNYKKQAAPLLTLLLLASPVVAKTYSVKIPHDIPLSTSERVVFEGEWVNIDGLYACSEPLPITNDIDENKKFTQEFECSQNQERDVTKEIYVPQTGEVLSSIDSKQSQLIIVPQSQDAVGTGNKCLTKAELSSLISSGADVTKANTSCITDFSALFERNHGFNQPIGGWDVSSGENFTGTFQLATSFNQDISQWDVSKATTFSHMFNFAAAFNGDVSDWDVSNAISFHAMFANMDNFNQNVSGWDVSNGQSFMSMFEASLVFNTDIGRWDVSNGVNFKRMFASARSFNKNISHWNVNKATSFQEFRVISPLADAHTPPKFR